MKHLVPPWLFLVVPPWLPDPSLWPFLDSLVLPYGPFLAPWLFFPLASNGEGLGSGPQGLALWKPGPAQPFNSCLILLPTIGIHYIQSWHDASNSTTSELSAHLKAIALMQAEDARILIAATTMTSATTSSHAVNPAKRSQNLESFDSENETDCSTAPKPPKNKKSHISQSVTISSDSENGHVAPDTNKLAYKKKCKVTDPDPINSDGFLADINIMSLSNDEVKPNCD
ncbi:uncharacterized protein EDB93DRAFT_1105072 [Suillus bovinus]|uniref:uncharacterized protein n=1 Tax=Suillus bovinus TaxID=48563 RepID=UPI001B88236F|nr:uncharacterized protein EDB93DRAFT_1105072 [Suillus bovinus]KAG2144175.1 hypothetical protein EDB93DRAFT_1105072 [Suillus bovinus]